MDRLKEWFKQFSNIPILSFEETKLLLNKAKKSDDKEIQNDIYNEVVLGTMYVVYEYIINNKLYLAVNQDFDIDDLISSFTRQWITLIKSQNFENYTSFNQAIVSFDLYYKSVIGILNDSKSIADDRAASVHGFSRSEIRNAFKIYIRSIKEKGKCSIDDIKNKSVNFEYNDDLLLELLIEIFNYIYLNSWNPKRHEKGILSPADYYLIFARLRNLRSKPISIFDQDIEEETNSIDEQLDIIFNQDVVDDLMKILNPQEQEVIKRYYGLYNEPKLNLEQIGEELSLTRARIGQVLQKAKLKMHDYLLKHSSAQQSFLNQINNGKPLSRTQLHYLELDDDFSPEEVYIISKLYTGGPALSRRKIQQELDLTDYVFDVMINLINLKLSRWVHSSVDLNEYQSMKK